MYDMALLMDIGPMCVDANRCLTLPLLFSMRKRLAVDEVKDLMTTEASCLGSCEICKFGCLLYVIMNMRNIPYRFHGSAAHCVLDHALLLLHISPVLLFLVRALCRLHVEFARHSRLIRVSVNQRASIGVPYQAQKEER
jgi:hypothetical protein